MFADGTGGRSPCSVVVLEARSEVFVRTDGWPLKASLLKSF
jgi:hypothetical protein